MRGWSNHYNSKLINGGIRLKQNRIKADGIGWSSDMGNYDVGWIKTNELNNNSAWTYSSIPFTKYFGLCMYYI